MKCPSCDYDLRGTDKPICPECGAKFKVVADYQKQSFWQRREMALILKGFAALASGFIAKSYIHGSLPATHLGERLYGMHFPEIVAFAVGGIVFYTGHAIWLPVVLLVVVRFV